MRGKDRKREGEVGPICQAKDACDCEEQSLVLRFVVKHGIGGQRHRNHEGDDAEVDVRVKFVGERLVVPTAELSSACGFGSDVRAGARAKVYRENKANEDNRRHNRKGKPRLIHVGDEGRKAVVDVGSGHFRCCREIKVISHK